MNDSELVCLVEQYKQLYDKRNALFKNKLARENAWETISSIVGDTAVNVESRWNILRNRYAKERRKIQHIPTGSAATGSDWYLFKEMGFLDLFILPRRTQGNMKNSDIPSTSGTQSTTSASSSKWDTFPEITRGDYSQQEHEELEVLDDENTENTSVSNENEEPSLRASQNSQVLKRKRGAIVEKTSNLRAKARNPKNNKFEFQNSIATAMTEISSFLNREEGNTKENEEDILFGKSLGISLSGIKSKKEKSQCKIRLLEVIQQFMDD